MGCAEIDGHRDPSDCAAWDALFYGAGDPTQGADNCKLPHEQVYDPDDRPQRRALHDPGLPGGDLGPRPESRGARSRRRSATGSPTGRGTTSGVQYGLEALQAGKITPGAVRRPQREDRRARHRRPAAAPRARVVDEHTSRSPTAAAQVADPRQLRNVPIIDLRAYSETGEIHTSFYSYKMRARLDKANGNHANQIIWTFPAAEPILGVSPPRDIG